MNEFKVLVTGGAGYIGSHTVLQLLEAGFQVVIYDNFSNSSPVVVDRIQSLSGQAVYTVEGDIRDANCLRHTFKLHAIDAVIHFAGLKAVGESEQKPLKYYDNNVAGTATLLKEMTRAGVKIVVFSSSATVYGDPGCVLYREDMPLAPVNVYGKTKYMVEELLRDLKHSDSDWRVALLRYFNPVGAHVSGLIGEDPVGTPNNLMPYIAQVAVGKRAQVLVFGDDYPTPDGTGRRDYIHVVDLAAGHLAALCTLKDQASLITVNLGTGKSYSVLDMIHAFERASGQTIPYRVVERRPGDLAEYYADPSLARDILNWTARFDIDRMCQDAWRWQSDNPDGYPLPESGVKLRCSGQGGRES